MKRRTLLLPAGTACLAFAAIPGYTQRVIRTGSVDIATLRSLLDLPDDQIDYAKAKLSIDRMVNPMLDFPSTAKRLDDMAAEVAAMLVVNGLPRRLSSEDKIQALRAYLYSPGPWNRNQVFKYDLVNDPTGKEILANKLLPVYLKTRLGNCVSMPILFLILAQKLGIEATLSTAPEHLFVKYRDDAGIWNNIEATHDGGPKRDASYEREFEITKQALSNGLYLRPLSRRESVAAMMGVLSEHFSDTGNSEAVHAVSDLILARYPRSVDAMLQKHSAYATDLRHRYRTRYSRFEDIPEDKREDAARLIRASREWYDKAEALGWRQPSKEFEEASKRLVKSARENQ